MGTMFMPKSEDVFRVADKLESVVHKAQKEDNLMFSQGDRGESECGTVCCHGGWYAVASNYNDTKGFTAFYEKGMLRMAQDLGFPREKTKDLGTILVEWARNNPKIWGNSKGYDMFCAMGAHSFVSRKRPQGAKKLQDIIDHWREVGERIKALEPPVYKDITKELAILPVDEIADCKVKKVAQTV